MKLLFLEESQSLIDALVDFLDEKVPQIEDCEEMWFDLERKLGFFIDSILIEEETVLWKDINDRMKNERMKERMEDAPLLMNQKEKGTAQIMSFHHSLLLSKTVQQFTIK